MTRNAPQWLLELGRREQEPSIHLGPLAQIRRNKASVDVFLRQVENDCNGLREDHLPVDKHGNPSSGVYLEERRAPVFASDQIYGDGLEIDPELLKGPTHPNGARRTEFE